MNKLIVIALLCLPNVVLANGLFRRHCNTCYTTPCYPPCPPKKEEKKEEEKKEQQTTAKTENKVIVQNNLYMPQLINTSFQFVNPAPEKAPEPLRQFGFQPNMPQYSPQPQPQRAREQASPPLTQQQVSPFIIQNVVTTSQSTTSTSVTSVNNGQWNSTTDYTLEQLNASERLMITWKKGGAAAALKKIEQAGLAIVFQPKASPFVIVTGKLDQTKLQSLKSDPITAIEPDAKPDQK